MNRALLLIWLLWSSYAAAGSLPAGDVSGGWTGPGYEYPLMWGLVMLAVALRGGGPYSLDRKLGREL